MPLVTATETIRWGQSPLGFEVTSSDRALLGKLALVLRPWRTFGPAIETCRWRAEPVDRSASASWEVRCEPCRHVFVGPTRDWVARTVEFGAVQAYLDSDSALTVHGALASRDGKGLLIVGRAEAGKSTLACALWGSGWTLLCDDVTVLDPGGRLGWPTPRRISLRHGSRSLVGRALWDRIVATPAAGATDDAVLFHPDEVDGRQRSAPVRVGAVALLDRRGRPDGVAARRLDPAAALLALLPYTNLRHSPGDAIRRLRPLADAVPVYDLVRCSLPEMVDAAERLLEPTP